MFKKYFSWLFGKSCCAAPKQTKVEESIPEVEVPEVVEAQPEPVAEAPAPRKPKKKYYKKKKPSNT